MDKTLVFGLIVVIVVGFFAYQWMAKRPASAIRQNKRVPVPIPAQPPTEAILSTEPPKEEKFPEIAGQTKEEALNKEPIQRREPSSRQEPALNTGEAPAHFDQHLRHPEQLFHQGAPPPSMHVTDVPSGRASPSSTPMGPPPTGAGQQGFSPEMAQNGGAFLGNSVFAFDGMEPTGFTAF